MNNYLLNKRTVFYLTNNDVNLSKFILGFLLYFIIFVVMIPYYLLKLERYEILTGYLPNLDLIASVIGYHGGPFNLFLWRHLYNPADSTLIGYVSSNLINYLSLLGVTYIIALYTFKLNDIDKGWSRAFIMLPMTYFIPSNLIIYFMNLFGNYINLYFNNFNYYHYFITIMFGLILTTFIILIEAEYIYYFGDILTTFIKYLKKAKRPLS